MSKMIAMAIPILPGKKEQWEKFANELTSNRKNDFNNSRKKLNVHERTFLQSTPQGDMVIVTLEGDNPEQAFADFAKGTDEFTNWFKSQAKEIHGLDLTQPPPGPMPKLIVDSKE